MEKNFENFQEFLYCDQRDASGTDPKIIFAAIFIIPALLVVAFWAQIYLHRYNFWYILANYFTWAYLNTQMMVYTLSRKPIGIISSGAKSIRESCHISMVNFINATIVN